MICLRRAMVLALSSFLRCRVSSCLPQHRRDIPAWRLGSREAGRPPGSAPGCGQAGFALGLSPHLLSDAKRVLATGCLRRANPPVCHRRTTVVTGDPAEPIPPRDGLLSDSPRESSAKPHVLWDADNRSAQRVTGDRSERETALIQVKVCGRCGGDVYFDASPYGLDISCLQCGSRRFLMPDDMRALVCRVPRGFRPTAADDRAA